MVTPCSASTGAVAFTRAIWLAVKAVIDGLLKRCIYNTCLRRYEMARIVAGIKDDEDRYGRSVLKVPAVGSPTSASRTCVNINARPYTFRSWSHNTSEPPS